MAHLAEHLATELLSERADSRALPLALGGKGSVAAAVAAGFIAKPVTVAGATGLPRYSRIALRGHTAVIALADLCGAVSLLGGRKAPLDASSLGLGQAIGQALRYGSNRLVLALDGSAGVDGGTGMLAALGFVFRNVDGRQLRPCGRTLSQIHTIDSSRAVNLTGIEMAIAGDVAIPLVGPSGAASVGGPTKGATPADVRVLDAGLGNLVGAFVRSGFAHAERISYKPGAGSGGGVGFAAMLLGARTVSEVEYFRDLSTRGASN